MPRKKRVSYSAALAEFICEHVATGLTVAQVCKKYKAKMPDQRQVYKWQNTKPEFKEMMNDAYQSLLMCRIEELEELSTAPLDIEACGGDFKVASEARRVRLDTLKFMLGKLAPILTARFQSASKLEVSGEVNNTVQIISYAQVQENFIEGSATEIKKLGDK